MATKRKPKQEKSMSATTTRTNKITSVNVEDIDDVRNTGRYQEKPDDAKVDHMAHSIEQQGQISPVMLRKVDKRFVPILGFTRIAACRKLKRPVLAEIVDCDEVTAQALSFSENKNRNELLPIDVAYNCKQLTEKGWTQKKIAEVFELSEGRISQLLRYLELPEKVREAMALGKLGDKGALALCRLRRDDNKEQMDDDKVLAVFSAAKLTVETLPVDPNNPEGPKETTESYDVGGIVRAVEKIVAPLQPSASAATPGESAPATNGAPAASTGDSTPSSAQHETTAKVTLNQVYRTLKRVTDNGTLDNPTRYVLNAIMEFIDNKTATLEFEDDIAEALGTTVDQLFPDSRGADGTAETPAGERPAAKKRGKKGATEAATPTA